MKFFRLPAQSVARASIRSAAAIAACAMLAVPAAQAHDSVIGGNVQSGSQLDSFPKEISLEFSAIPKEGFNTFAVTNVDSGEVLFDGEPKIDGRELSLAVPSGMDLGAGNYQVGFQITSSDGHATRGSVPFVVRGAAAQSAVSGAGTAEASASDSPVANAEGAAKSPQSWPLAAKLAAGGGAVLAVAAVAVVATSRAKRAS